MTDAKPKSRLFLWLKRVAKWTLYAVGLYALILLVGLIPVNNGFRPPDEGITLYIVSSAVHADIIVPISTDVVDWEQEFANVRFGGDVSDETHVAFGWGDRGFFLETPTWDDLKFSTAANALLLPSGSCVHVDFTRPEYYSDASSVTVSEEQYRELVRFFKETMKYDENGDYRQIHGYAYSFTDAFFEAKGQYHLLNTCNSWVGRGLKTAGVRVPWLSPLPKSPMLYVESDVTSP